MFQFSNRLFRKVDAACYQNDYRAAKDPNDIMMPCGKSVFGLRLAYSIVASSHNRNLSKLREAQMSKCFKIGFFAFAIALISAPSISDAQINTRRGTIAGAVIGGIIGDQNNEALAGVAIGGIVGNVVGRTVDRNYGGGYYQQPTYRGGYQQPVYQQPVYQQPVYQQPVYQPPVYRQPVYQQPYRQPVYGGGYRGGCGGY